MHQKSPFDFLQPHISGDILKTVLHTFHMLLLMRIYLAIKCFFRSFPLFIPFCLIQGQYCEEK